MTHKRSIKEDALEPNLYVALPGKAQSSMQFDGHPSDRSRSFANVGLRKRRCTNRFIREMIHRMRGVPPQRSGGFNLKTQPRDLVLH